MAGFLYNVGFIVYQIFTLWLAMLGVLMAWDVVISKLRSKRRRRRLCDATEYVMHASILTVFALAAACFDTYILSPTLGAGINFFFAG